MNNPNAFSTTNNAAGGQQPHVAFEQAGAGGATAGQPVHNITIQIPAQPGAGVGQPQVVAQPGAQQQWQQPAGQSFAPAGQTFGAHGQHQFGMPPRDAGAGGGYVGGAAPGMQPPSGAAAGTAMGAGTVDHARLQKHHAPGERHDGIAPGASLGFQPVPEGGVALGGCQGLPMGHATTGDKIIGKVEKAIGKATHDYELQTTGMLRESGGKEAAMGQARAPIQ